MNLITGQKMKLSQLPGFNPASKAMTVSIQVVMDAEVDITCFGLDFEGRLSDDRYMIFYNQMESPQREIRMVRNESTRGKSTAVYEIDVLALPEMIKFLSFTAAIDGAEVMKQLDHISLKISQNGTDLVDYQLTGADFNQEKAIILFQLYFNQEWRINAVGKGFNGGLEALLKSFGGEAEGDSASSVKELRSQPAPPESSKRVSLEKRIEKEAPALVSLVKSAKVSLAKAGLADHTAKVALCLDISGSMMYHYRTGEIQKFAERILALGSRFDDDGSIDIFLFGKNAYYAGECTISNYHGYITNMMKKYPLEGSTNYQKAIHIIREHYISNLNQGKTIRQAQIPVYVMFLTDGDATDRYKSEKEMVLTSYEPIFWSFMGIGNGRFKFLEKLDDLKGRYMDNASLLKTGKPSDMTDEQLYDGIMKEYKTWVPAAKNGGLIG